MATSARGFVTANPYSGATLAASYTLTGPSSGSTITSSSIESIRTILNQELTRRNLSTVSSAPSGTITASYINSFNTALNRNSSKDPPRIATSIFGSEGDIRSGEIADGVFGNNTSFGLSLPLQAADPPLFSISAVSLDTVTAGTEIESSVMRNIITQIQNAGAVCLCNCNYCTCNCNYCTCNCNYSCTCNCNYSDRRLKRNIKFIKNIFGINVYTFTYVWSNQTQIGVMAQELLDTKYRHCVSKDKKGFFMVNYSKLPFSL
jgi:hypothetical protein